VAIETDRILNSTLARIAESMAEPCVVQLKKKSAECFPTLKTSTLLVPDSELLWEGTMKLRASRIF
jgi:hypothetical protein